MASLLLFNKPYGVLSQFTTQEDKPTLAEFIKIPRVYPAGRLDHDSEGLLLLTDDGDLQHHISHPAHKQPKTYWVQVEGAPNSYALTQLRQGVALNDGITQPAEVRLIPTPRLWERNPPIRSRTNIPTQWMEITISEGKNRQVRRMTAAVGHPTLRLVRVKIGPWTLEGIEPGTYKIEQVNAPKAPAGARRPGTSARPRAGDPRASRKPQGADVRVPEARSERGANTTGARNAPARAGQARGNNADPRAHQASPGRGNGQTAKNSSANKPKTGATTTTVIIQKPRPKLSLEKKSD